MNDIAFPSWVTTSPVFAMASLLGSSLQQQYAVSESNAESPRKPHRVASPSDSDSNADEEDNDGMSSSKSSYDPDEMPLPRSTRQGYLGDQQRQPTTPQGGAVSDILNDARVLRLFRLSKINDICTGMETIVSVKHATALVALMAFAVDCRKLPSGITKGFYTECSSLYATLMTQLPALTYRDGLDVEGMVASLVACGLQLRHGPEADVPSSAHNQLPVSATNSGRGTPRSNGAVGNNIGLSGFDHRITDGLIVSCIPQDIDSCVQDALALGALQGLASTYSGRPVFLGPSLVNHLHNLTDAFATSPHRRDLAYKKLLALLLEALSCSRVNDYERINNWITAIIQETYVVRGLFQREVLHARVVAAILTLLVRQYQDLANEFVKVSGGMPDGMPDFTEGDQLIDLVWKSLQEAVASREEGAAASSSNNNNASGSKPLTLYGSNLRVVLENLLRTEVERLRCYHIITSASVASQQRFLAQYDSPAVASPASQWPGLNLRARDSGAPALTSSKKLDSMDRDIADTTVEIDYNGRVLYFPSDDEEVLRVRILHNITRFLLLPGSMVQGVLSTEDGAELRGRVLEVCTEVLTIVTATDFTAHANTNVMNSLSSNKGTPSHVGSGGCLSVGKQQARFSNQYYQRVEVLVQELIRIVMDCEDGPHPTRGSGEVAAECLRSLCTGDAHVRSFAVSEVMDAVVRVSSNVDKKNVSDPQRLSLCLDMLCEIIVPRHYSVVRTLPHAHLARYGQLLCDMYEDSLRHVLGKHAAKGKLNEATILSKILTPNMKVVAEAYWKLVVRVHERLRVMARDAVTLPKDSADKRRYMKLLRSEEDSIRLLIQGSLHCQLNIAWPASGILSRVSSKEKKMPALALACISPFLKPLCLLLQLSTLYPLRSLQCSHLIAHSEHARYLTLEKHREEHISHYYYRPTQMTGVDLSKNKSEMGEAAFTEAAHHLARFRSYWLMMTYYGFSSEAVALASAEIRKDIPSKDLFDGAPLLSTSQALNIRLIAASAAPFMQMRSSDLHQSMADIEVLFRCMNGGTGSDTHTSTSSSVHKKLSGAMKKLCGWDKHWDKLTAGELYLMHALTDLEMLRASSGSIANLTLYHHFEIREFVATPSIQHVMKHITNCVCAQYLHALRSFLQPTTYKLLKKDINQLVLLLSFSIASVRESARALLTMATQAFPHLACCGTGLSLLFTIMNIVEAGTSTEIESFCRRVRFNDVPAVPAEASSKDRKEQVEALKEVAEEWIAVARAHAPRMLFQAAAKFTVAQTLKGALGASGQLTGSRLAAAAAQPPAKEVPAEEGGPRGVLAIAEKRTPNFGQTLIRYSSAQGQVLSTVRVTSFRGMERELLGSLRAVMRQSIRQSVEIRKGQKTVTSQKSIGWAAAGQMVEVDSLLCSAAAALTTGFTSPTGTSELLRYSVEGPIHTMDIRHLQAGIGCWRWLLAHQGDRFVLPLLQCVCQGIEWTIVRGLGFFDGAKPSRLEEIETGDIHSASSVDAADYENNSPHKVLFGFLADAYVDSGNPWSHNPPVLLALYNLCTRMVEEPDRISLKDTSFAETMRCMVLIGNVCRHLQTANTRRQKRGKMVVVPYTSLGVLRKRWYLCLLRWFRKSPPSWYFARDPSSSQAEVEVLEALAQLLKDECSLVGRTSLGFLDFSVAIPRGAAAKTEVGEEDVEAVPDLQLANVWGIASSVREQVEVLRHSDSAAAEKKLKKLIAEEQKRLQELLRLNRMLVLHEILRLRVWQTPRRTLTIEGEMPFFDDTCAWDVMVESAAYHDPAVMVAMVHRFPSQLEVHRLASQRVIQTPERFMYIPEAVDLYVTREALDAGVPKLHLFTPCHITQALRFLDEQYAMHQPVTTYAIRSLLAQKSEHLIFYLPQLLQVLSTDSTGSIQGFLERMSHKSTMFCHQLLWSLQTEGEGDSVLAKRCQRLADTIRSALDDAQMTFYRHEFEFTNLVTSLSGELMQVEKPQRKPKLRMRLRDTVFHEPPQRHHLYLPTDPDYRIVGVIPHTAGAMQSAAKCPILVQFQCVPREHDDTTTATQQPHAPAPIVKACIFKMGDDCRQDQISLQLIGLMKRILGAVGVPFFLYPYRVVTTGQDSGIIECVPRSLSRNEIGKLVESNVAEYFVQTFGHPESVRFHRARDNFVKSVASYSVVSYILNIKDRHNGNIMVDADGHQVHIDFGFLFDTSPGGDMNFESSPFKLTTEMVQLIGLDVGSASNLDSRSLAKALIDEESYVYFKTLVNRCYLAVRQHAREICILVELMLRSGLPCFKPKQTIANLAQRLAVGKTEVEAADFMRRRIHQSRQNFRTVLYDKYQQIAEGIEM